MPARKMRAAVLDEPERIALDEKPLRYVAFECRSRSARANESFAKVLGLLIVIFAVFALFAWAFQALAAGDLSRQTAEEVHAQLGEPADRSPSKSNEEMRASSDRDGTVQ